MTRKPKSKPAYELGEFNEKGIAPYTENGETVFIHYSEPKTEQDKWLNLPYGVGFYIDRNGEILGTIGHGCRTLESAIESASNWCTGPYSFGWLDPNGKFWKCAHSQHSSVVEYLFPDSNRDEMILHEKGYIIRRWDKFELPFRLRTDWGDRVNCPTNKQQLAIIEWCKKHNEELPDFMKEFV